MACVKAFYSTGQEEDRCGPGLNTYVCKQYALFESMSSPQRQTNYLQPSSKQKTINLSKVCLMGERKYKQYLIGIIHFRSCLDVIYKMSKELKCKN